MKSKIVNDVSNELNTSPGLYLTYISSLISAYESLDQDLYYISKNNFQNYVIARYHQDIRTDDQMKTINEVFQTISQQTAKNNLIVFDSLIDIDFGDNRTKADRIAKYMTSFDLFSDPNLYTFFDHILFYLYKTLRSSIHLILQPIRDKVWSLNDSKKPDEIKAGIYTLMILIKNFSFCFKAVMSKVRNYICDILKSTDTTVRSLTLELLKQLITTSSDFKNQIPYLVTDLIAILTNTDSRSLEGYILASEMIIDNCPDKVSDFKFKTINFDLIDSYDNEKKLSGLSLIPFQVRTSPELFNTNQNINFFTKIEPLLSKKNPNRNEALVSFGKFIFNQRLAKIKYTDEVKIINKCKKVIIDSLDSKQAIYALLASLIVDPSTFERESSIIFQQSISNYLVDGFKTIIEIEPSKNNFIWTNFMYMADKLFLSNNPSPDQLTLLFQSFLKLEIPNTLLTVTNAIQYSKYLYSPKIQLKKAVVDFLLKFNKDNQSEEIILILLTFIGIETDEAMRIQVIEAASTTNLVTQEIVIAFQSFLNDYSRKIREYSYSYLNRFLYIQSIKYPIAQNLYQEIKNIRETGKLMKENLEPFLELCKVSFSNSSENSDTALSMLTSFAPFLIDRILSEQKNLFSAALEILHYLVQILPENFNANMASLVKLLASAFTVHPTPRFLQAALNLFLESIEYTTLKISIYNEYSSLISKLLQLTKLPSYEVSYDLLFQSLIVVGSIRPSIITHSKNDNNYLIENSEENKKDIMSVFTFIAQSASNKNQDKLVFASVGVSISHIFYILDNDFLSTLHSDAVSALVSLLNSCRQISDTLSNQILHRINILIRSNSISTISTMLSSIHVFLAVFGEKFSPIVSDIVDFVCDHWNSIDQSLLTKTIIHIIQFIPESLTAHLPRLVKCFITGFEIYPLPLSLLIMSAFDSMESAISTVDFIVYPAILSWISMYSKSTNECKEALSNARRIFAFGGTTQYSTLIVRTMTEIVSINSNLNDNAADVLTVVARQLGKSFMMFVPLIETVFTLNEKMPLYQIIKSYETNSEIPKSVDELCLLEPSRKFSVSNKKGILYSKNQDIQLNIPTEPGFSSWYSWGDDFFSLIIRQSNSRAIQLCGELSERHLILKEALAPISIALMLIDPPSREFGEKMKACVDTILLQYLNVPKSLTKTFLDSFELFELLGIESPVNLDLIFNKNLSVGNYQQALRAGETLFEKPFNKNINYLTSSLLSINQKLGLPLANKGILILAKEKNIQFDVSTDEKLGFWDSALQNYSMKLAQDPNNKEIRDKSLKCIQNMLQFNKLKENSNGSLTYKASAHWHLLEFEQFATVAEKLSGKDENSLFYRILLDIYKGNLDDTGNKIATLKQKKMNQGLSLISDDYENCLPEFNKYSIIYDLESARKYKMIQKKMETAHIYDIQKLKNELEQNEIQWKERFDHLPYNSYYLYEQVCIRSLVMSRDRMKPYFDRLIHTLIDQKQTETAKTTLMISDAFNDCEKNIITAEIEWAENNSENALKLIQSLIKTENNPELPFLAGKWLVSLNKMQEANEMIQKVLPHLAARSDVWKLWAKINLAISKTNPECLATSFEASINGLIRYDNDPNNFIDVDDNIKNEDYDDNVNCKLNFVLPILSILFCHGNEKIYNLFLNHLKEIPPNSWFDVLPQIIARMNSKDPVLRQIVQDIIVNIGKIIPHATLYSLLVPLNSNNQERKEMAQDILNKLKVNYPQMIDKTIQFTEELIRIGTTWWEKWNNQINEAFRALYKRQSMQEMVNIILPLLLLLKKKPETLYEVSFYRSFGPSLSEAKKFFYLYIRTKDSVYLHSTLNIFLDVSNQMKPIINSLDHIILEDASPILSSLKNFDYNVTLPTLNDLSISSSEIVTVEKIEEKIDCIKSKQKPRKVTMIGSNGKRYLYLLKANEDTRLDERVMQLFTFINTLTARTPSRSLPLKKRLNITTYDVIPLTNEVGLIGWVPNSKTISQKIMEYRQKFGINPNAEIDRAIKFAGGTIEKYENLPLNKKVDAFKQGFKTTSADDLSKTLFLEATSSEHWLQRRTNYTASLVMTSIVGYIIGLGDRHTNNIMMNEKSAKLVHIDFGDCFEVAIHRSYRPEKVPFRLTRILVKALEVSKIEGTFRCTCENLMKLLRRNSDQILGLLNVFEYDPLLQWIIVNENQGMKSALSVLNRIDDKLNGRDFDEGQSLTVEDQIDKLITEATSNENLANMFYGWGPWW